MIRLRFRKFKVGTIKPLKDAYALYEADDTMVPSAKQLMWSFFHHSLFVGATRVGINTEMSCRKEINNAER